MWRTMREIFIEKFLPIHKFHIFGKNPVVLHESTLAAHFHLQFWILLHEVVQAQKEIAIEKH